MDVFFGLALSLHVGLENDYNGIHPNAGVKFNNLIAGAYYNSEETISPYIAYDLELSEKLSVEAGLVGGYSSTAVLPMIKVNYGTFFLAPAYENYDNSEKMGMLFGVDYRF